MEALLLLRVKDKPANLDSVVHLPITASV